MPVASLGLGFLFTARDMASQTMGRIERNFGRVDRAAKSSASTIQGAAAMSVAGLAAMAAGAAGLRAAMDFADAAGEFEQKMARVGAVSLATAGEMDKLTDAAIKAGIETQFSPTEAAEGLGNLAVQGFNAKQSIDLLNPALDLAAGGQIGIGQAAKTTAAAVKVFGLEMDQAALAADQLLRISNATSLEANDLETALGSVSRGAVATKQRIEEMLPAIGLVKNTGVEASRAANSVSSALVFMAKRQDKFKKLGVSLTDSTGKFRPFLDIIIDTQKAMSGMQDEAKRAALSTELFSRFGQTAFSAITSQLEHGITTTTGQILKGEEAVAHLRKTMEGAKGAAAEFKDKMLDTFKGQKTLLEGSVQTFKIAMGDAFARAFRPLVERSIALLNRLIRTFRNLPQVMQDGIAKVAVFGAALLTAVGAGLVLMGILAGLKFAAGLLGIGLLGAVKILAVVAVVALAVYGAFRLVKHVIEQDLGGIGTALQSRFQKVVLFLKAMRQLLSDGFLSGAVRRELREVENSGVAEFIGFLARVAFRAKKFWEGLVQGVTVGLAAMEPQFALLRDAFEAFEAAVLRTAAALDVFKGPSEDARMAGFMLGRALMFAFRSVVKVITVALLVYSGFIDAFRDGFAAISPVVFGIAKVIGLVISKLADVGMELMSLIGIQWEARNAWITLGKVIGFVMAGIIGIVALGALIVAAALAVPIVIVWALVKAFLAAKDLVIAAWEKVGAFFEGLADRIKEAIQTMLDTLAMAAEATPEALRPQVVQEFIDKRHAVARGKAANEADRNRRRSLGREAVATEIIAAQRRGGEMDWGALADKMANAIQGQPIHTTTTLNVDGRQLAKATAEGERSNNAAAFGATAPAE